MNIALGAALALAAAQLDGGALGWYASGDITGYEVTSLNQGSCGTKSFLVRSQHDDTVGPAVVMQTFEAKKYEGQKVRFTAKVDARGVLGKAGLFIRVNEGEHVVAIDEMRGRWLRGDTGCELVTVVMEIPGGLSDAKRAPVLSVGIALHGAGAVELSDPSFGIAPSNAPVTLQSDPEVSAGLGVAMFNEEEVRSRGVLMAWKLRDGVWFDGRTRALIRTNGDSVTQSGTTDGVVKINSTPQRLELTGRWASGSKDTRPFSLVLTPTELTMKFATDERHLAFSGTQSTCNTYAAQVLGRTIDRLMLCGDALTDPQLRVPLLLAAFVEGFEAKNADVSQRSVRSEGPYSRGIPKPTAPPKLPKPPGTAPP